MAVVSMTKLKTLSLSKFKVVFFSLFLGFFLIGCGEAQAPNITLQPKDKLATANRQSTLQVSAKVSDGGVLTYQWYSSTKNSTNGGTAIEGANSDVFTFDAPSDGVLYYYVVVTNTKVDSTSSSGTASKANTVSKVAIVTIVDYDVYDVLFYDKYLNLLEVKTIKGGESIDVEPNTWYPANSAVAINGSYEVKENVALFAVPNVVGITNRAELEAIKNNLDGTYVLQNNINLNDLVWTPIGDKARPFTGKFSGKSHKITGLTVNSPSTDYVGLFGYINGGNVLSLKLELGSDGIKGNNYVGGIAGYATHATITSVTVNGDIKGNNYVGGIAGAVKTGTITATSSTGNIEGIGDYVGGVAGYGNVSTITATYVKGDITSLNGNNVGGVAGYSELGTITATYGYGKVTGNENVGGVVGYLRLGTVVASHLQGKTDGRSHVGNVVGRNSFGIIIAY